METLGTKNNQCNLEKEKKKVEQLFPFQNIQQATVITTAQNWHKDKHTDQWNRVGGLETNPYSQLIFLTSVPRQFNCAKKDNLYNKWCWDNWISTCV
jgi:hypothetical protein